MTCALYFAPLDLDIKQTELYILRGQDTQDVTSMTIKLQWFSHVRKIVAWTFHKTSVRVIR